MKVGFCVSGNGSLFRAAVAAAEATRIVPAILIVERKAAPELDAFAAAHAIPTVRLDPADRDAFNAAMSEHLAAAELDLIVLTFDRILPAALVEKWARRIINVHPALLPAFAGTRGITRTIEGGVRIGGATIHEVVEAVDAGPIVAQAAVPVRPGDDAVSYGARLYAYLEPMFLQVLRWYAEDRIDRDARGRVVVRGARYDTLPIVPALEHFEVAG